MKNFKRKVVLLVASILVMAATMTAFASPTPRWSYIGGIQGVLEISNGNADVLLKPRKKNPKGQREIA